MNIRSVVHLGGRVGTGAYGGLLYVHADYGVGSGNWNIAAREYETNNLYAPCRGMRSRQALQAQSINTCLDICKGILRSLRGKIEMLLDLGSIEAVLPSGSILGSRYSSANLTGV